MHQVWGTGCGGLSFAPLCRKHLKTLPSAPDVPCSEVWVASVGLPCSHTPSPQASWPHRGPDAQRRGLTCIQSAPLLQAGPLTQVASAHTVPPVPTTTGLLPALSQALAPLEPPTSVFPLLWQERRVSSLEAHSVACGRSTQT